MTNNRMPVIQALGGEARWPGRRRCRQLMPINHRRTAPRGRAAGTCAVRPGWRLGQACRTNLRVRRGRNSLDGHAPVYDDVVVHDSRVVHDCSLAEHIAHLQRRQRAMGQIMTRKIVYSYEGEMFRVQAEIKTDSYMHSVITPAAAKVINRVRRQGRPAAGVTSGAPGDPRRTPDSIRAPNPAGMRVHIPPAIVERRPAPGIIRVPVPAAI